MSERAQRLFLAVVQGLGVASVVSSSEEAIPIFAFQDLHCEIEYLFGSQEPRSLNPGRRQIFDAGDDDVYLCVLRKSHGFRQFYFATLDDCLVGENLHRIQIITGSAISP